MLADVDDCVMCGGQGLIKRRPWWGFAQKVIQTFVLFLWWTLLTKSKAVQHAVVYPLLGKKREKEQREYTTSSGLSIWTVWMAKTQKTRGPANICHCKKSRGVTLRMAVFHLFSHQETGYHLSHLTGQDRGQLCLVCAWPNGTFAHLLLVYTGVTQRFNRKCWYDKYLQVRTSLTSIKKHTSKLSAATAMSSILNCISWKLYILSILQMTGPGYTTRQTITAVRNNNRTRKITRREKRKKTTLILILRWISLPSVKDDSYE